MSSNTYVRMRPLSRVTIQEGSVVDLTEKLGPGACEAVREVLGELSEGKLPALAADAAREYLGWRRTESDGNQAYELTLRGNVLPQLVRSAGIEEVVVRLTLGAALLNADFRVSYQQSGRQIAQSEAEQVRDAIRRTVNHAINVPLAFTAARKIQRRVKAETSARQLQSVVVRAERNKRESQPQMLFRTVAHVRVPSFAR